MRHLNSRNTLVACIVALAVAGCSQKTGAPDTAATSQGAAADVATREQQLAAKEQDLAQREAALRQQEEADAQAKAAAEAQEAARLADEQAAREAKTAAAAAAAAKAANKPVAKPTTAAKAAPTPIVVPAGTQIAVALSANVNTKKVTVGSPVQGTLASDVTVNGRRAAATGAAVQGTVTKVVSGSDKIGGVPSLGLRFDSLVAADGSTKTINAPYSQDGVSETGKDTAKIVGGTAAGAIIGHQVDDDKGAVVGGLLGAGAGAAAAKKTGGEVKLTAGTVLTVTTQSSFEVKP